MATNYKYLAHVFVDEVYQESYPMMKGDRRQANRIFRDLGYFVGKKRPFTVTTAVDSVVDFMHNEGAISMEDFQNFWGLDVVTWIWGREPLPNYVLREMGVKGYEPLRRPPAMVWTAEEWKERRRRSVNLLTAIERALHSRRRNIAKLFTDIARTLAHQLHGDEYTIGRLLLDIFVTSGTEEDPY